MSVSHFASNRKKCMQILSFSFEMGENVSVSHFASYRKKNVSETAIGDRVGKEWSPYQRL